LGNGPIFQSRNYAFNILHKLYFTTKLVTQSKQTQKDTRQNAKRYGKHTDASLEPD